MVSTYPPVKGAAFTAVFPILDADGDLVTGAAGLDSEISKDLGTFADCTNEATEIATSSGMYYLTLTATEMTADIVAIIVKTSTSGAKTTALVFYTSAQSLDTVDSNVDAIKAKTDNLPTDPADDSDIDAQLATIVADTNELQTDWVNGGRLDLLIDGIKAKTDIIGVSVALESGGNIATILADTNELQTDWVNGGRLDLLVDAIKAKTDIIGSAVSSHSAADVWAVATRALTDKANFSLSTAGIDAIIDDVVEGTLTLRQAIRIFTSALAGKSAGGGTNTLTFQDVADSKARITATVDGDGNRTAITLDGA